MTRKTEIEVAAFDYAKDIPLLNTARNGFEAGAQWADEHPNNLWKDAFSEILKRIEKIEQKLDNIYDEL